jgi:hypothetical protein
MTRRTLEQWLKRIAASAALVFQAAVPAFAEPATAERATGVLPREILHPHDDDFDRNGSWLRPKFHLQKKSGVAFTHRFAMSNRPFVFRIQGPVMRKQKALGITFKIRF